MNATTILLASLSGTAFYVLGSVLAVLALTVTAIGLRSKESFSSRAATRAGLVLFAAIVVATAYFAVDYSEEEQARREAELAAEEAEQGATEVPAGGEVPTPDAAEAEGAPPGEQPSPQTQAPAGGGGETLRLSADPQQIAFDTTSLSADAGQVTIDFSNPSQVGHDVAIEQGGQQIAKTEVISDGEDSVTADLQPGRYTYYCTVPGHREAGMQGTLTVR